MDLLKKELERKKKTVEKAKSASGGRRFFRASELRRQEEEQEDDNDDDNVKASRKRKLSDEDEEGSDNKKSSLNKKSSENEANKGDNYTTGTDQHDEIGGKSKISQKAKTTTLGGSDDNGDGEEESAKSLKMSAHEITQRLRALGFPIKLFGESTLDRLKRLQKALDEQKNVQAGLSEMEEFRLGRGHGIRNPFLEKDDDKDTHGEPQVEDVPGDTTKETAQGSKNAGDKDNNKQDDHDNDLDENDPHKRVYKYFKGLVKQWEEELNLRPDAVKKSVAGRNETKTFKQCKDYVRPMFKLCKNRRMDESILTKLNKIVSFCLEEEFVKAHDVYIDISIGRAAWPIGVTQVGIHSRTGRAKIESSNIAHVMNSELQRKYLTSVKRLMTYAQKHSNADPSKKVL